MTSTEYAASVDKQEQSYLFLDFFYTGIQLKNWLFIKNITYCKFKSLKAMHEGGKKKNAIYWRNRDKNMQFILDKSLDSDHNIYTSLYIEVSEKPFLATEYQGKTVGNWCNISVPLQFISFVISSHAHEKRR